MRQKEKFTRVKGSACQWFEKVCMERFTEGILTDLFYASYVLIYKLSTIFIYCILY